MPTNQSGFAFINKQEAAVWLQNNGLGVRDDGYPVRPFGPHWKMFEVPPHPSSQIGLAWHLVKLLHGGKGMLLLTEWYTSTETEMQIFLEVRMQYKEYRSLTEAPGCLFGTLDIENEVSLVHVISLMFAFNFEGFLFAEDKSLTIWLADEVVELAWSTENITPRLEEALDELLIVPYQQSSSSADPAV